jgi:integrase
MASILKRGRQWQARVRRKGYPTETKTFLTKTEALCWTQTIESEMNRSVYVSLSEAERTTFGEILDRYMLEVSPHKRSGADEIIRLKAIKRHRMSKLNMAAMTATVLSGFRDERLKSCAPSTVVRELGMLSSIFNHCIREWRLPIVNPVSHIRKPSMHKGRDRILSTEEEQGLLDAFEPLARRNIYMQPLVIVAIESAMRRGELLKLKWADIDLKQRTAYLQLTKNGEDRMVPLSTRAVNTLKGLPRSIDGKVFSINAAAMEAAFHKGRSRANLPDVHFHDLRHTATTRLAEKLTNILELSAVTGHKDLRMLKRYYHPKAEDLAKKIG